MTKISSREVFSRVYRKKEWGSEGDHKFFSGSGSADPQVGDPYVAVISKWADQNGGKKLVEVDLGCGDFRIGSRLHGAFKRYVAIDIVPDLIDYHQGQSYPENVSFQCVDAINEDLPDGDVIFVGQVLRHLSNAQISVILSKLEDFKFVIVSEHLPNVSELKRRNADKNHGGGSRVSEGSGAFPEGAPFDFRASGMRTLLSVSHGDEQGGIIETKVFRRDAP